MEKLLDDIINNKDILAREIIDINKNIKINHNSEYYNKSVKDTISTIEFMVSSLRLNDKNIFIEYIFWLKDVLVNLGLDKFLLINNLEDINSVIFEKYKNTHIKELIEKTINLLDNKLEDEIIKDDAEDNSVLFMERKKYLEYVLSRKHRKANELIFNLIENNVSISDIYYYIFELSQKQVGKLWQKNELSIADEHYITAVTQSIISQMYPYIFKNDITKDKIVCMSVEGELHELGIRMIADMLSLDGWDSNYYGANLPVRNVIKEIKVLKPKIVVLSATLSTNLDKLEKTVNEIRLIDKNIVIFVGGTALKNKENLATKIGADHYTKNFKELIKLANKI